MIHIPIHVYHVDMMKHMKKCNVFLLDITFIFIIRLSYYYLYYIKKYGKGTENNLVLKTFSQKTSSSIICSEMRKL